MTIAHNLKSGAWRTNSNVRLEKLRAEGWMTVRDASRRIGLSETHMRRLLPEPEMVIVVSHRQRIGLWRQEVVNAIR
jgi:hypothetical protein